MKAFCREFSLKAINLAEFVLENNNFDQLFIDKLDIIKYAINVHIDECDKCENE